MKKLLTIEWNPTRPSDENFVALVEREIAEAHSRACETLGVKPKTDTRGFVISKTRGSNRSVAHRTGKCSGCGGDLVGITKGCKTCAGREGQRRYQAKKKGGNGKDKKEENLRGTNLGGQASESEVCSHSQA